MCKQSSIKHQAPTPVRTSEDWLLILSDFHSVSISEALSREEIVVAEMVANMEVDMVAGMEVEKVVNMFHLCLEKKKN